MNIKSFLNIVGEEIRYKPIRNEIVKEIKLHIEEVKEDLISGGMTEIVAEEKAVMQMGNPRKIGKNLNKIYRNKIDWKLIIIILILACFSFLNASNKGFGIKLNNSMSITQTPEAYVIAIALGLFFSLFLYHINYKKLQKSSSILYILATILTIMHFDFGKRFNETIFSNFDTTILSVPIYIIAFIGLIEKRKIESNSIKNKDNIGVIILSIISIILVGIRNIQYAFIIEMVYLIILSIKLANKKENIYKLIATIALLIISICLLLFSSKPNIIMINKEKEIINEAKLFGKINSIDLEESYFIKNANYAFICLLANNGWIISCGVILVVILLNIKLIINAKKVKDPYGKFLIIGIAIMFILETVLNLVMNIGLGVPSNFNIPLVSYGKINLIIDTMCLVITLAVYRKKNIIMYTEEIEKDKSKVAVSDL